MTLALYAIPSELNTDEEHDRWHHLDLPRLTDEGLWSEEKRVELELAHAIADRSRRHWSDPDCDWLRERARRVRAERQRRRTKRRAA